MVVVKHTDIRAVMPKEGSITKDAAEVETAIKAASTNLYVARKEANMIMDHLERSHEKGRSERPSRKLLGALGKHYPAPEFELNS